MTAQVVGMASLDRRRLALALDEIPGSSILVFDTDLRFLLARGSAMTRHGFDSGELEGRLAREVLAPDRWAFYHPRYEAALAGRSTSIQVTSPDGTKVYQVRTCPLREGDGRIVGGVAISTDVTDSVMAHRQLAESEATFRLLAENASDVVLRTDAAGVIDWVSPSVARVLGWETEEFLGHTTLEFVHPDELAWATRERARVYAGGRQPGTVLRLRCKSGQYRWMSLRSHSVPAADGTVAGVVVGLRDVHDETLARHALAASELLFRTAMKSSLVGMALTSLSADFQVVNPALCQLLGREESWMLERGADDVIHPQDVAAVRADRARLAAGEVDELITEMRLVRSDGATLWTRRSGALIRDQAGRPERLVLQWEDLTGHHHAQEQLAHRAFHDPLTGLRNRAWMLDMLEVDLAAADRDEGAEGLLFIDLDHFKAVNDSLGHVVGDEVLCEVAHRIAHSLRPNDHVGRFGGDEFVVLVSGVRDRHQLEQVAARISDAVSQQFHVHGHPLMPSVSIGMALARPGMRPVDLLRDADAALYQAKADGRKCWRFFDKPELRQTAD